MPAPRCFYVTIDMLVKPISQIDDTHHLIGHPLQLVVEADSSTFSHIVLYLFHANYAITGEVMNHTKAMLDLDLIAREDLDPGKEYSFLCLPLSHICLDDEPISYGCFTNYTAVCGFIGLCTNKQVSPDDIFAGTYASRI